MFRCSFRSRPARSASRAAASAGSSPSVPSSTGSRTRGRARDGRLARSMYDVATSSELLLQPHQRPVDRRGRAWSRSRVLRSRADRPVAPVAGRLRARSLLPGRRICAPGDLRDSLTVTSTNSGLVDVGLGIVPTAIKRGWQLRRDPPGSRLPLPAPRFLHLMESRPRDRPRLDPAGPLHGPASPQRQ